MLVKKVEKVISHVFNMFPVVIVLAIQILGGIGSEIPPPPSPEPIEVVELPLPPVSSSKEVGACTAALNPHGTGCIAQDLGFQMFQAGDFTPDGKHVIANVEFVGAPAPPDPASIYTGQQAILIKADGTNFSSGDPWKCISCIPAENRLSLTQSDNPHVLRSGDKAIWGHNIIDCDGESLASDTCTPNRTHIYPIYWSGGTPREMRIHPDDKHAG